MIAPTGGSHGYDRNFSSPSAPRTYYVGYLCSRRPFASWPPGISRLFLQNLSPESELSPQAETERATRRASGGGRSKTTIGRPSVRPSATRASAVPPVLGPARQTPVILWASPKPESESLGPPLAWRERVLRHGRQAAGGGPTLGPPSSMGRSVGRLRANGPLRICQKRSQPKRLSPSRGTRSAEEGHF